MKIRKEKIWEVLQQMYNSEIHFAMWWLWDGWVGYSFDVTPAVLLEWCEDQTSTWESDMGLVFGYIVSDALTEYKHSLFAKWFNENKKDLIC